VIAVDASVMVELLANTTANTRLAIRMRRSEPLHAPHLLDLEVANVLRRYGAAGVLTPERARDALADYRDLRIERHSHLPYLERIWELRHNFTAYDAVYLALADALGTVLLTRDAALARAPLRWGRVEVV
jgi:predicted nucleic acid-binding protein